MLSKIEKLNKNIEKLMNERTKAEAQKDVWKKRLFESLEEYEKEYGVSLSDKSFAVIKNKLSAEISKVEAQTTEEYEKAQKIVNLIQIGDIDGAWELCGGKPESSEEEVVVVQEGLQGVESTVLDIEDDDIDDDIFFGKSEDVVTQSTKSAKQKQIIIEEDDDDDVILQPSKKSSKKEMIIEEDDDDDDISFGGFGSILEGTPFKVDK